MQHNTYSGLESVRTSGLCALIDGPMSALARYRGGREALPMYPPPIALRGATTVDTLGNRIILTGTVAPGLFEERAAQVARVYPAVESHTNLAAGMLDDTIKQRPPYVARAEVALLLLIGLAMTVLLPLLLPLRATLFSALELTELVVLNLAVWSNSYLVSPLASCVLMVALFGGYKLWEQFLHPYRSQKWEMGESQLLNMQNAKRPRQLHKTFYQRIAAYRRRASSDAWDGAYRCEAK